MTADFTRYLSTFAGRRDCYAAWADDDWQHYPEHVAEPMVRAASLGGHALAFYSLGDDGRSQIAAADFDDRDGLQLATTMAAWLVTQDALPYLEPSRNGRAHLWVIFDMRLDVTTIRRGLATALMAVPALVKAMAAPDQSTVELRPMTVPRAWGNAMRGPLFPHPRTGVVYPLIGPRGDRCESIAELRVERTPAAVWQRLARQYPWRVDADSYLHPDWPTIEVAA